MKESHLITAEWDKATPKAWDRALEQIGFVPYQQHYAYGEVVTARGGGAHRVRLFEGKELLGVAQVILRRLLGGTLATVIMGPVWRPGVTPMQKKAAYSALKDNPPLPKPYLFLAMPWTADSDGEGAAKLPRVVSSYHTVLLDLSPDEEDLLKGFDGKWRNRLRAAEKEGLTISQMGRRPEQYEWLLREERNQQLRLKYKAQDPGLIPFYQLKAGQKSIFALEAKDQAGRIGGMLFLLHGNAATYHIGWASEEGRGKNVHNFLLWSAIKALKKKGVTTLDLGGVDTDHVAGIARFKLGTGSTVFSQSGTYLLKAKLF
ncbi:MAG: GNAT family N-acetyltransferase [Pseudomonadota bacterium]